MPELSNHHRRTVEQIFATPTSGNVEWHAVRSLLEAAGTVEEEHNGLLRVTLGPETEVVHPPHGKDVSKELVHDLRRMLEQAGYGLDGAAPTPDERTRDYGDSRWGDPKQS